MQTHGSIHRKNSPFYGPERFTYQPESNRYICPAGQPLNYGGRVHRNRAYNLHRNPQALWCVLAPGQCTSAAFRCLVIHRYESARQRAGSWRTRQSSRRHNGRRKKVEALFAELKNQIGLRRLRLRRLKSVPEQFFLAAAAQSIKRLVRFLSQPTTPILPATA